MLPPLTRPWSSSVGVPLLTSMAYHWTTSWVELTETAWVATMRVVRTRRPSWIRESMLVVMTVPLGLSGLTTPEYGVTARLV